MADTSKKTLSDETKATAAVHYDQFFGPLYFEPYAIEVAKRINRVNVAVVLEIAAGTGRVTRHIRERILPATKLIASDISEEMLTVAKKKLGHFDIDWQHIDAQQLPFNDNSIDVVVCCFAYMFVPDQSKAFTEVWRVLRPGGHFLFTTWDKLENNPASYISRCMAEEYLEEPLPASYDIATSMSDEMVIRSLLQDTGFSKLLVEKVKLLSSIQNAKEAALGFVQGGSVYDQIRKRNPGSLDEIKIKLEKQLADQFGDAPMVVPISALISQAWK
ncbi:MAG: class I SAM-dependent methyltransferase [Chitinophagaceae bacterium]